MPDTPNILLIITDHHAFRAHDRPGEYDYRWPRFERFAAEGMRFDRAYSVCPLCTPARASMMTGLFPSAHGLVTNTDGGPRKGLMGKRGGKKSAGGRRPPPPAKKVTKEEAPRRRPVLYQVRAAFDYDATAANQPSGHSSSFQWIQHTSAITDAARHATTRLHPTGRLA